jgi:hypothetical protein
MLEANNKGSARKGGLEGNNLEDTNPLQIQVNSVI